MPLTYLKYKLPMLSIIILASSLLFGGCDKDDPVIKPPVVVNNDPAQYGTPFAEMPDARDATIYQVNMRVFSDKRNFQGVIDRLDSIKALGVNVIYLMPIQPVGTLKAINSPYCIKDFKAVNAEFGTLTDLRKLIDESHNRGMAVILDWIANHTAWDHAWINNPSWYVQNSAGVIQSPKGWNDVAQLNFKNNEMRLAMISAMKYWALASNCDGFRCDYADGPPTDFWKQAIDTLRNIKSHKLLLLAEGTRSDHFNSGFDFTFGFRFYEQLKTVYSNNQPVTNFNSLNATEYNNAKEANRVVRYITNHDVNSSDGTPLDLFGGNNGSMAAFVVSAYMKAVPMIYNGQEVGMSTRLTFPFMGTTINWTSNPTMEAEYKKIIAFRNSSTAIRRGDLNAFSNSNICAFTKTSGTENVLVVANLRNSNQSIALPVGVANSNWKNAFNNEPITLSNQINLTAYQYLILKK